MFEEKIERYHMDIVTTFNLGNRVEILWKAFESFYAPLVVYTVYVQTL